MFHNYNHIISLENLYQAWREFTRGKKHRRDVAEFSVDLVDNIYQLHLDLKNKTYCHGPYEAFNISDPKPRNIHKASVRDRLLHHAIYRILHPFFDRKFVHDSYSCRFNKGTHRAVKRFRQFSRKVSLNNSRTSWILKGDIRKFFASIDHKILLSILKKHGVDQDIIWLCDRIINSFHTEPGKGLPLGNLTSQLLVNIYMNEFDQFIKHQIKAKYYIRYADDFVMFSYDKNWLGSILPVTRKFLIENLKLGVHPKKVSITTLAPGVDFLGWIHFPNHLVLRTSTKKRMMRRLVCNLDEPTLNSYLGLLKHGNAYNLSQKLLNFDVKRVE